VGDLVNWHCMSERLWHLCCGTVVSVDFYYLLLLVLQGRGCVFYSGGNSYRLFNLLQSFMFDFVSIYYLCYVLVLEWLWSLLLVVGRYMCKPWRLFKQEPYFHQGKLWYWSLGFLIPDFFFIHLIILVLHLLPRLIIIFFEFGALQGN